MKTFMYGTAIALLMSTSAMAQESQVKEDLEKIFVEESISIDPELLSDELALEVYAMVQGGDRNAERSLILAKLRDSGYIVMDMERPVEGTTDGSMETATMVFEGNSLRDEVKIQLIDLGYTEIDTATLSDEQVSEVYLALQNDGEEADRARIDAVLAN